MLQDLSEEHRFTGCNIICKKLTQSGVPQNLAWRSVVAELLNIMENSSDEKKVMEAGMLYDEILKMDVYNEETLAYVKTKLESLVSEHKQYDLYSIGELYAEIEEIIKVIIAKSMVLNKDDADTKEITDSVYHNIHQIAEKIQKNVYRFKEQLQNYKEKVKTDSLTGLYNRYGLIEEISKRAGSHVEVAIIDLDNFKFINDHYNHLTGDEVLKFVASVILNNANDCVTCRYGGDEFLIIKFLDDKLNKSSERIRDTVSRIKEVIKNKRFKCRHTGDFINIELTVGISEGYVGHEHPEKDIFEVIKQADYSLLNGKKKCKGEIYCSTDFTADPKC